MIHSNSQHKNNQLFEGLEQGDLKRLVHPELHLDEFKSKLGEDRDVIVLSLKVDNKQPGVDLVGFIEKGYDFVLDADVSSGEMDDGAYIVFVEIDRNPEAPKNIIDLMEDLLNLTGQTLDDWRVRYYKSRKETILSLEALEDMLPVTPEAYNKLYGDQDLDSLKTAAGMDVTTKAPKNDMTEWLRNAAGIIR